MAGNFGKFIDRNPYIFAAGKASNDPLTMDTVAKTFKEYTVDDAIEAIKRDANIREKPFEDPLPKAPVDNKNFYLTNTEISGIMMPGVQTRYQTLLADMEETVHDSYWNKELGKQRDQTPGLPKGMVPVLKKFGRPYNKELTMKQLINPSKSVYEVLWDSQVGHENYVKSHGGYNIGEQLHRNYVAPFDSTKRYGYRSKYDYRGIYVKCSCEWHEQKPISFVSKRQADYFKKNEATHREIPSTEKTGLMPKENFYQLCRNAHVTFSMQEWERPFRFFGVLSDDDIIDYKACLDLINPGVRTPDLMKVKDMPLSTLYYVRATAEEMKVDESCPNNALMPPAGLASVRTDLVRPRLTDGIHKPDLDSLPDATVMSTVISPSVYTHYGLTYRDFLLPRKPETLKKLFEKIGYSFPGDTFEKIWKEGVEEDETGLCCVDTFKKLLEKYTPRPKIYVDESDCRDIYPLV